jgi:ABC-type polysaccharide/polyol phosphate export permease
VFAQLTELFKYREAARLLTLRELQVRYSHSLLGVVWSFFHPLLLTLFFTLVFTALNPGGVANYPIFFLAGLLPWNFFNPSVVGATHSITNNNHLINRVYFPRELLPLSVVAANGLNFLIALAPLFLLMLVFGVPLTLALAWLPVVALVQFAFSLGLGLALSALNVIFRDTQQIIEALMLPWFFLTPIVYMPELLTPTVRQLSLILNPMASLVTHYRQVIYAGRMPDLTLLGITTLEALAVLVVGALIFRRLSPHFIDEL